MDIYKLKFTVLQQEIFRFLCLEAGREFTSRSLARRLGVSPTAIAKSLPLLKKERLVVAEKDSESGRMAIGLNLENDDVRFLKKIENLRFLHASGLVGFLAGKFSTSDIYVGGDYAEGIDRMNSVIGISVVGPKTSWNGSSLEKFEKILDRKIDIKFVKSAPAGSTFLIRGGGK